VSRRLALVFVLMAACVRGPAAPSAVAPPSPPSEITSTLQVGRPGAAGIGDALFPDLGNGGYEVDEYELAIDLDTATGEFAATATIQATAQMNLSSFNLDLAGLEVTDVRVDGSPALFQHQGGELTIRPGPAIAAGRLFSVVVEYRGVPRPRPAGNSFRPGWRRSEDGFYSFSEPDGASTWFPANDHPLDPATYRLKVTVPADLEVVSSGRMESSTTNGGRATVVWVIDQPAAPYLLPLAIGQFEVTEAVGPEGIPVRVYASPEFTPGELAAFSRQPEMIEFFAGLFGRFPFTSYGALVIDDPDLGAALETQGLSTFAAGSLAAGETVVSHELVHQWFGNAVAVACWCDIWLNEGLATYGQWLWTGHQEGEDGFDAEVEDAYSVMSGRIFTDQLPVEEAARLAIERFTPPHLVTADDLFNPSVYLRGGLALAALADRFGATRVNEMLAVHYARHTGKNSSSAAFEELAGEVMGEDLAEFFDTWLRRAGIPPMPERGLAPLG